MTLAAPQGSKHDSEWNRELLWRMYVESENEFYSLRKEGGVPPYMESVAAACALAPRRRGAQKAKQGLSSVCPNAHEVRHAGALPQLSPIRASQAIGEFVGTPAYEEVRPARPRSQQCPTPAPGRFRGRNSASGFPAGSPRHTALSLPAHARDAASPGGERDGG